MTPTQRKIFWHMKQLGTDIVGCTGVNARRMGFGAWEHATGGLVVRAYGTPLHFMKAQGWMVPLVRHGQHGWYILTEAGAALRDRAAEPYKRR